MWRHKHTECTCVLPWAALITILHKQLGRENAQGIIHIITGSSNKHSGTRQTHNNVLIIINVGFHARGYGEKR